MSKLKLKFGSARNGWLPLELVVDDQRFEFCISYTPNDFLLELIVALDSVLKLDGTYIATSHEEPVEHEWRFLRQQDESVVFSLVSHRNHKRNTQWPESIVTFWGSPLEVVLPFWRGLRDLNSRVLRENFKQHWSVVFPESALDALSESIFRLKNQTS